MRCPPHGQARAIVLESLRANSFGQGEFIDRLKGAVLLSMFDDRPGFGLTNTLHFTG